MPIWNALNESQKKTFPPLCPDFVIELRSPSDSLNDLRGKMQEYLDNGARLGWLIDPLTLRIEIYRPGEPPEEILQPTQLSDDNVLPGFILDLQGIL